MDVEVAKRWVVALRSGEYQQGTQYLHRVDDGEHLYCCVGVLNEILGTPSELNGNHYSYQMRGDDDLYKSDVLNPRYLEDTVGLPSGDASYLAELNDNGKSFDEIADWIEENVN